jgi:hypothetical protein
MSAHRHKAASTSTERAWSYCVRPERCAGRSHGGVVLLDTCSCGATRETESNGGHTVSGLWESPRGVGRPVTVDADTAYSFRAPQELLRAMSTRADSRDISTSEAWRQAARDWLAD